MQPSGILKPRALNPGDTIGIVAPASPFDPDELECGMDRLRAIGFRLRPADGLFERSGYLAGSDVQRAAQLHQVFTDDTIDAVMCARGGYGTLRLLSRLDYDLIRSHAKAFIGFSDITALHVALGLRSGLVTFHGPTVTTLGKADRRTLDSFREVLTGTVPFRITAQNGRVIRPGAAEGVLAGGNLNTLNHLLGTPFAPHYRGAILLIEDTREAPYRVDRMLTQMRLAGIFDGLAGVAAGSFKDCGRPDEIDKVIEACFGDMGIPILAGCGIGHDAPNATVPLGVRVQLVTAQARLCALESALIA